MQEACEAAPGSMAAIIGLDEGPTREVCAEAGVELANLNCPGQLVISGEKAGIDKACELAKARGAKRALPLAVAGAYHSRLMASAQPKLREALGQIPLHLPSVPVISNVTAQPHHTAGEIHAKLVEQVTNSVRWEESMRYLLAEGSAGFTNRGPAAAWTGSRNRIDKGAVSYKITTPATLEAT